MRRVIFLSNAGRNSGGPEIYESELVRALAKIDKRNEYHLLCWDRRAPEVVGVRQENFFYHMLQPSLRPVSMLTSLPAWVAKLRPVIFHAPVIPPLFSPVEFMMTLVCSTTFRHPEYYPPLIRLRLRALLHRGIVKARRVLCISRDVKRHAIDAFRLPEEKFEVVYLGASERFRPLPREHIRSVLRERYGIDFPYFLYSGRWEPRKNILGVLRAFALLRRETRSDHRLVLTGQKTWAGAEADKVIEEEEIRDYVVNVGKSPVEELPVLYGGATALVFVSFWEGFGMPIVEAMACGTPVITSNVSAMPEIAGPAGILVNPHSIKAIAEAMHRLSTDADLRRRLSKRGLERAVLFRWDRTARQTLEAYERMADEIGGRWGGASPSRRRTRKEERSHDDMERTKCNENVDFVRR